MRGLSSGMVAVCIDELVRCYRSPYVVGLLDVVERFATTPERIRILDGLLRFRADLHQTGIVSGFQWLDGSFMEQVEILEHRPPRDLDVVNFLDLTAINQ